VKQKQKQEEKEKEKEKEELKRMKIKELLRAWSTFVPLGKIEGTHTSSIVSDFWYLRVCSKSDPGMTF
jgi:hypothetical protein